MQGLSWRRLTSAHSLNLRLTLTSGQVFTWTEDSDGIWRGVIGRDCIFLKYSDDIKIMKQDVMTPELLKEDEPLVKEEDIGVDVLFAHYPSDAPLIKDKLIDFFQLSTNMLNLYSDWATADSNFEMVIRDPTYHGLRIIRQDPFECLCSFIISQNNHVKRISSILISIRQKFGEKIPLPDGSSLYTWPSLSALEAVSEAGWREMGLGYRAKYYASFTSHLYKLGGVGVLNSFRGRSIEEARDFLTSFHGVGRKVADCVALFSLDFAWLVPCDTHVFEISKKYFKKPEKCPNSIQNKFFEIFGKFAGWAHCVLFAASLRTKRKRS